MISDHFSLDVTVRIRR